MSSHPSLSTLLCHASKLITWVLAGKKMSSLSMTLNGSISWGILAPSRTFMATVLMQAIEKTRKWWYSKLNNSAYSLLFLRLNGNSLRRFVTNLSLPPRNPLVHEECLGNHCTLQQQLCPWHEHFLSQTLFPRSWRPASCHNPHQVLSHLCLFSFPMDGQLPQRQVVCLRDWSQRIS